MTFYQAMQLGTSSLKPIIKKTEDEKLKKKYTLALITKNILCVLFCMIFITLYGKIFGAENSIVGVVTVIALLTFRFSNLDFKVSQSAFTLFGVFFSFTFVPVIAASVNPILGAVINFFSILLLVIVTCHNVLYSNQSIIILSYLLLFGYEISSKEVFVSRAAALVVGGIIVASIFYIKNRKVELNNTIMDVLKDFKLSDSRTKWQIKLALGISTGMLIGEILNIPRVMWIGFACMSILQPVSERIQERVKMRPLFMIIGCIIFGAVYYFVPEEYGMFIGILGGIMVGFSATYNWQTVFNCFGALIVAVPMFGLWGAIIIRIVTNCFGAIYSKVFNFVFEKAHEIVAVKNEAIDY
ncbi:MAG: FUSC family protein [Clostridium sp.]